MTAYLQPFDRLIWSLLHATRRGRAKIMATHRKLVRQGVHRPSVPPGWRVVAGKLVHVAQRSRCEDI